VRPSSWEPEDRLPELSIGTIEAPAGAVRESAAGPAGAVILTPSAETPGIHQPAALHLIGKVQGFVLSRSGVSPRVFQKPVREAKKAGRGK